MWRFCPGFLVFLLEFNKLDRLSACVIGFWCDLTTPKCSIFVKIKFEVSLSDLREVSFGRMHFPLWSFLPLLPAGVVLTVKCEDDVGESIWQSKVKFPWHLSAISESTTVWFWHLRVIEVGAFHKAYEYCKQLWLTKFWQEDWLFLFSVSFYSNYSLKMFEGIRNGRLKAMRRRHLFWRLGRRFFLLIFCRLFSKTNSPPTILIRFPGERKLLPFCKLRNKDFGEKDLIRRHRVFFRFPKEYANV